MPKRAISSWKAAQALVPAILERLNADQPLLLAALANPLFALEELGYEIAPSFEQELVDRIRFRAKDAVRIRQLREEIFAQAGGAFDLESERETVRILFERLTLPRAAYDGMQALRAPDFSFRRERTRDPLEALRGEHPLVDSLLEFRRLNARAPKLAPRELYNEIKAGKHRLSLTKLHVRFQEPGGAGRNREKVRA